MRGRLSGVCYCKVDGDQIDLEGTINITPGMVTREMVTGSTGAIGYSETPRAPTVEVTCYPTKEQLKKLLDTTGFTVTAELASGAVFVLSEALVTGDPSVDAQAGTASITFTGVRGEWI